MRGNLLHHLLGPPPACLPACLPAWGILLHHLQGPPPACLQGVLANVSHAEQMIHEYQMVIMGITADMIANNKKFTTDYRRALANVALQCEDKQCMSALGLVGTALGYASWLEVCASALVLLLYFRLVPEDRMACGDAVAIAVDAPAMPADVEAMRQTRIVRKGNIDAMKALAPPKESADGPVVVMRKRSSRLRFWQLRQAGRKALMRQEGSTCIDLEAACSDTATGAQQDCRPAAAGGPGAGPAPLTSMDSADVYRGGTCTAVPAAPGALISAGTTVRALPTPVPDAGCRLVGSSASSSGSSSQQSSSTDAVAVVGPLP